MDTTPPLALKKIAHYKIEEELGQGAMGTVYRALDENLGRAVALKVVANDKSDVETRARFEQESKALARIDDPHVVRVYASGNDDGHSWMALELIEGLSLHEHIKSGIFDEETAFSLGAQLALGLAAVHEVGVLHRDVKPGNIIVDDTGRLRIVDFGIAQVHRNPNGFKTGAGIIVGTPHYMSPEQARGEVLDERVDAWATGATLYAMLTGKPPYYRGIPDEPDLDILSRMLHQDAKDVREVRPEISQTGARYLKLLLSRDKDARPGDLREVANVFDALVTHGAGAFDDEVFTTSGAALRPHEPETGEVAEPQESAESARSPDTQQTSDTTRAQSPGRATLSRPALVAIFVLVLAILAMVAAAIIWPSIFTPPPKTAPDKEPVALAEPTIEEEPEPAPQEAEEPAALVSVDDLFNSPDPASQARLLERIQDHPKDALRLLEILDDEAAREKGVGLLSAILFGPHIDLQPVAIERLSTARNLKALNVLRRAEKDHPRKSIRRLAQKARSTIFSVE